jgi:hypothetical protein
MKWPWGHRDEPRRRSAHRGYDFWRGLMDAKGWTAPRRVSFLDDLRAGRMLADLDRAA